MLVNVEKFDGGEDFVKFAKDCELALFDGEKYVFKFPQNCSSNNWLEDEIKKENETFLKQLKGKANIYSIFIRDADSEQEWMCKYVGQRKSEQLRDRITQHFISKGKKTGSKLNEIKKAVDEKQEIAVSFIKIHPESLRLFVEGMIIEENITKLEWNKNS